MSIIIIAIVSFVAGSWLVCLLIDRARASWERDELERWY